VRGDLVVGFDAATANAAEYSYVLSISAHTDIGAKGSDNEPGLTLLQPADGLMII
jgi:hypothetical protein